VSENELANAAGMLVDDDKSLLAMDESAGTRDGRFTGAPTPQTEQARASIAI
jgi:hypothetical protein